MGRIGRIGRIGVDRVDGRGLKKLSAFYNDNDARIVCWLSKLIDNNLIMDGFVDGRSIADIESNELAEYTRCHFFAGIGGWDYALQLAQWPENEEVWTGSCPCQPFSVAGKKRAEKDERHLWPEFRRLIAECRPATIFGEQVASRDGRNWLDRVRADLEALGYAVGAADLCAACVGSPHIRQRLYWVAHSDGKRRHEGDTEKQSCPATTKSGYSGQNNARLEHADVSKCREQLRTITNETKHTTTERNGVWSEYRVIQCRDNKTRRIPVEPEFYPLAHGVPGGVGLLRGYGNAIVPQVAAKFISAFMNLMDVMEGW